MEPIEDIIDLDELQEDVVDDKLKEFMSKDEEASKLLKDKIEELSKEEEKLEKKEEEVRKLEESSREKISANASPDELIEIAGKIKEAEEELKGIRENIQSLTNERENLIETKNNIEASKKEYIKSLNSTNSSFEEQLVKISEAIEVCDNPALKQALMDVKEQKERELTELQEKRNNELKMVLNEKEDISSEIEEDKKEVSKEEVNQTETSIEIEMPKVDIQNERDNIINIDSILTSENDVEPESQVIPELNVINTQTISLPEVNPVDLKDESRVKIIFEKDVPDELLREIFNSSSIMPALYDYLEVGGEE